MAISPNYFIEWFDSPYYHKLYFEEDGAEKSGFIRKLIESLSPAQGSKLLDAACGNGNSTKQMAQLGYEVTGIDIAPSSVNYALQFESEIQHFYLHDLRLPFWINYFHYAFSLFTSLGYFTTERENHNAVRTLAQSLLPGGKLVIDFLNVHYEEDTLKYKIEKTIGDVNYIVTRWMDESHFYKKIIVEDEQLKEPLEFLEQVAKFSLGDFNDMLAFHNMQVQQVYGDYELGSYDIRKSPRLIIVAEKRSNRA